MNAPADEIKNLEREALKGLDLAKTSHDLEQWRIAYIGRKGAVPRLLRTLKDVPEEERKRAGQQGNELRKKLEEAYQVKYAAMQADSAHSQDHQLPASSYQLPPGHLHPITLTIRRVQEILASMGFVIVEGPEIEEEKYNFDLLNIPLEHSARGEMDTFHVAGLDLPLVLRTHTSPVQLRAVLEQQLVPPFAIASPGRVFRSERTDATHETTFHQFEGLLVGDDISIADFKSVITQFYSAFFGQEAHIRLRPSYFPFVEPGFEVDVSCVFCGKKGCRVCKYSGWIEIMGAGMVHPNVLANMNIDPAKYQGFAFGGAIDRLAMLRHNINDIRLFWSGDIRFLKQFS